ncbi:MAG: PH domain-containing protein [Arenimonas sp.]|nr:PH domain-containing protein [Arenimonas sp.]
MPTPSDLTVAEQPEQRLHPLSWLFELLNVLKQFILPILFLLLTGKGNNYELWGLVGIGFMVPLAVARYISFRYRIGADRIVIRSGLLHKTVRDIAFTRVQNVTLHQGLLHRLMQVAEVRLETGGGEKEEGRMRVLGLRQAQQLQRIIRSHDKAAPTGLPTDVTEHVETVLLQLPTRELLKLGVISNKGMILVAAAFGGMMQFDWQLPRSAFREAGGWLWDHSGDLAGNDVVAYVVGGIGLLLTAFIVLRLISMLQAILHYHGFVLRGDDHRLSISRGLLNRFNGSLPRTRIQAWTLQQGWLQRRFQRFALRVDAAAGGSVKNEHMESHWQLAPIADDDGIARIIGAVMPGNVWPVALWRPLHPNAWKREFKAPALFLLIPLVLMVFWFHAWGLLLLSAYPWLWLQSKLWAKHAGYSHANGLIAVREGWIGKNWRFAEVRKVQAVYLKQSPFDRRHGMAAVFCDTVNAGSFEPPLAVRYLPFDEARTLHRELSAAIAR